MESFILRDSVPIGSKATIKSARRVHGPYGLYGPYGPYGLYEPYELFFVRTVTAFLCASKSSFVAITSIAFPR